MEFLHLGLLPYFLPLAAIPIILHLLTLHRLKTVELSTFRFLFDSYVQQRRRMKFLEALIALLRTLFLLFLVLSVARPVVKHWDSLFGNSSGGRDVVFLFDTSASMATTSDGVSSIRRAKQTASEIVERLSADDRVTILQVAAKPKEICNRFSSDSEAILSEIQSLDVVPSRANLFAAFSHLFGGSTTELTNPLIYVFTDMQSSGWSEFSDGQSADLIPEGTELFVVNVGSNQEVSNQAIVGGAPAVQHAVVGLPITLRPQVANYSVSESAEVSVSVFIDEKEIARTNLALKPGETNEAEIIYTPNQPGVLRGRYEIMADDFTDDDTFLFSIDVAPQLEVLLVNGHPAPAPLDNEGLYLRTAMTATDTDAAESTDADTPDPDQPDQPNELEVDQRFVRSLDVQDIPEANLNAEILRQAHVVVLANCGALKPAQMNQLCDFVHGGGGLLIFPGDKVNPDVYNKQLFPAATRPDEQLVTAELGPATGDLEQADTFQQLGTIDFAHPVFSVFGDPDERYLTKVNVFRQFPVKLPEEQGSSWPLAEFAGGEPALLESRFGQGRVLLCAFPFNAKWTNLPLRPEFVPLVLRMVAHVKRSADLEGPSVVPADGAAEFIVDKSWAPASAKVTDIAGRVTPVPLKRSHSRLMGAFDRTTEKGFYTVQINGGRTEQPKSGTLTFAVNLAAGESNFETLNEAQLSELAPAAKVTAIDASAEALRLHGSIGSEQEIWRPLIVLLFIIIGCEFLLSTLSGQSADGEQPSASERIRDATLGRWVGRMTGAGMKQEVEGTASK